MSLIESDYFSDLFIPENIDTFYNKNLLSDNNLNDILSELTSEPPKKNIKFILTKEDSPSSISLLKKKISLKPDDINQTNSNGGRWNKDEQYRFAEAVLRYGNDWKKIQNHIFSRNITQVRSHAQKFLMKLKETDFIKNQKIDQNLSWTKVMNYLRSNVQYNDLKELLFSVEQNDEKKVEKKKVRKIKKNSNKSKKNKKLEISLSSGGESNCDTNGESHFFFESDESSYEYNNSEEQKKEEDKRKKSLERFIECFNWTNANNNLNSSFIDDDFELQLEEDENQFLNNSSPVKYKNSFKNI